MSRALTQSFARRPLVVLAVAILLGTAATYVAIHLLAPASLRAPVLLVSGDVKPGAAILVEGSGFVPGRRVELALDGKPVEGWPTVTAGGDGAFAATVSLPDGLDAGRHSIGATDGSGSSVAVAYVTALLGGGPPMPGHTPTNVPADVPSNPALSVVIVPPTRAPETPQPSVDPTVAVATPAPGTIAPTPAPTPASTPTVAHAGPMPGVGEHGGSLDCSGYAEPRVWVESQDWWSPIPVLEGMGHMHMGMCFPHGQTVSGVVPFDVRVVLHHNAGKLIRLKLQDDDSTEHIVLRPNRTVGDGVYWYTLNVDTRAMPDGLRLFRFYADLEHPNGNTQTARPILPLRVDNGGADRDWSDRDRELRATAWYREAKPELDWGYVGAVIENFNPGPHGASATFEARCFVNGESGGEAAGAPPLASWSVHVDPDFHNHNEGLVVAKGTGQLNGAVTVPTGGLTHGWHRLVVRCNQLLGDREHAAVGVFSILVDR